MAGLPLFSGIEYRVVCWVILMLLAIIFVLWQASKVKKLQSDSNLCAQSENAEHATNQDAGQAVSTTTCPDASAEVQGSKARAWISFAAITISLILFAWNYAADCVIKVGSAEIHTPWLLWAANALFVVFSLISIKSSTRMYILNMLMFTIVYLVIGVMGYGWYLPEICALFMALAVASGFAYGYSADNIAKEFIAGAKDIFSAALIIGFAAGIIVILKNGEVIDKMLGSMASALENTGRVGALGTMYGIQTFINLFIPSASAKAAITMPIMAPFSDMINVSRQATVLAFQFGDGFTNMITPCSGVLMAVLSVARIPYEKWVKWIWKFILFLIIVGFLLLLPTLFMTLAGF
jgi:uncharacterized ion transporter superfamily protein YfcC